MGLLLPAGAAQARPAVTPLALDRPLAGLSGPAGSLRYFQVDVPRGVEALEFATGGGVGDCDLYVQPHTPPTLSAYYARSTHPGPVDRVRIRRPRPGPWFVALHAATNFQGVGLRARAGGQPAGPTTRKYPPVPTAPHGHAPTLRIPPSAPSPLIRGREDLLAVTSPANGQTLYAGQTVRIAWGAHATVRRLRVEFSANDGKTFTTVTLPTNLDARRGEAYWRIPAGDARFVTSYGRILIVSLDPTQGHFPAAISGRIRILPAGGSHPPVVAAPPRRHVPPPVVRRTPPSPHRGHYRPGRGVDPYENNNSRHRPSTIQLGQAQTHTIYPDEDEDWIRCPIPGPGRYVVQFTHVTVDEIEGEVYRPSRHAGRDEELEDFEVDRGDSETVRVDVRRPVRYLKIRVQAEDDDEKGAYTIRVLRL
jgi:hypothetical protein